MSGPYYDEKTIEMREEKGVDEKWSRDPLGSIFFAVSLIWLGVVLLLTNLGRLTILTDFVDRLGLPHPNLPFELPFADARTWQVFFLGAAAIVIMEIIIRLLIPMYRRPVVGSILWAGVLLVLALWNWTIIWPLALVAIGVSILLGGLIRRR
jgi:hypothetical protein